VETEKKPKIIFIELENQKGLDPQLPFSKSPIYWNKKNSI